MSIQFEYDGMNRSQPVLVYIYIRGKSTSSTMNNYESEEGTRNGNQRNVIQLEPIKPKKKKTKEPETDDDDEVVTSSKKAKISKV